MEHFLLRMVFMKKIIVLLISILSVAVLLTAAETSGKKAVKSQSLKACKIELRKCVKEAKKSPKGERKAKVAECRKTFIDCRTECKKTK